MSSERPVVLMQYQHPTGRVIRLVESVVEGEKQVVCERLTFDAMGHMAWMREVTVRVELEALRTFALGGGDRPEPSGLVNDLQDLIAWCERNQVVPIRLLPGRRGVVLGEQDYFRLKSSFGKLPGKDEGISFFEAAAP